MPTMSERRPECAFFEGVVETGCAEVATTFFVGAEGQAALAVFLAIVTEPTELVLVASDFLQAGHRMR